MKKCEKCGQIIYNKDPLTRIGTGIGYLLAIGVSFLTLAGVIWTAKVLIRAIIA